jgi:hypothetical protein
MRRFLISALVFLAFSICGVGCLNIGRVACECGEFYLDIQRNIFGIDYPHGARESGRQKYIGIEPPPSQYFCDN